MQSTDKIFTGTDHIYMLRTMSSNGEIVVGYGLRCKQRSEGLNISGAFIIDETDYCSHADKTKVEIGYFGLLA